MLSSACERTSAILGFRVGRGSERDSRRHSTTSFCNNVVVTETSNQMLKVLLFGDRGRTLPLSIKITVLTSMVKTRYNEAFLGVNVLRIRAKTLSQILSSWSFWSSNLKVSNMAAGTSCESSPAIVMIIKLSSISPDRTTRRSWTKRT